MITITYVIILSSKQSLEREVQGLKAEIQTMKVSKLSDTKQVVKLLSFDNRSNLIDRLDLVVAAFRDNRDLQLGMNQSLIAIFQIDQTPSLFPKSGDLVKTLELAIGQAKTRQTSIFNRLSLIESIELKTSAHKKPVHSKKLKGGRWLNQLSEWIQVDKVTSDQTEQGYTLSNRVFYGILEQLKYDLMNGNDEHYYMLLKRLYDSGYASHPNTSKMLGELNQPLAVVDIKTLEEQVQVLKNYDHTQSFEVQSQKPSPKETKDKEPVSSQPSQPSSTSQDKDSKPDQSSQENHTAKRQEMVYI